MLGTDAAAQDLVQDTFVKLWRNADRYDITRGQARDLGAAGRRSSASTRYGGGCWRCVRSRPPDGPGGRPRAGPEELAETGDLAARARRAMEQLSGEQRAALELAYFGGKTSTEVAELEGIPVGTAKTRIRTALLRLRESMAEGAP